MSKSEPLDAALTKLEAGWAGAIANSARADARPVAVTYNLFDARDNCRRLSAALIELNRSESIGNLEKARTYCREVRAAMVELDRSASIPFHCLDVSCALLHPPRKMCWLGALENTIAVPSNLETASACGVGVPASSTDQALYRSNSGVPAQQRSSGDASARPPVLRQTIDLLALILAYILYFHVDVQLQILSLPSIFP